MDKHCLYIRKNGEGIGIKQGQYNTIQYNTYIDAPLYRQFSSGRELPATRAFGCLVESVIQLLVDSFQQSTLRDLVWLRYARTTKVKDVVTLPFYCPFADVGCSCDLATWLSDQQWPGGPNMCLFEQYH